MSYSGGQDGVPPRPAGELAEPPRIPRAALDGVRTRRIIAVCLDFIIVSTLSVVIFFSPRRRAFLGRRSRRPHPPDHRRMPGFYNRFDASA